MILRGAAGTIWVKTVEGNILVADDCVGVMASPGFITYLNTVDGLWYTHSEAPYTVAWKGKPHIVQEGGATDKEVVNQ